MYRTLLATCGSAEMKIIYLYIKVYEIQNSRSHASNVRYISLQ